MDTQGVDMRVQQQYRGWLCVCGHRLDQHAEPAPARQEPWGRCRQCDCTEAWVEEQDDE